MKTIHLGTGISYEEGLKRQDTTVDSLLDGTGEETLFLLEHAPVYTIGRLRDQSSLRDTSMLPAPVVEANRGGQATYHGPGQLVGYPILDLRERNRDLHAHLRGLEEALILTCHDFDIPAGRREGLTGVWVENRKLASIGVGVRKWISMHGFAINITPESLLPFFAITPCGIDGVIMSCVAQEARKPVSVADFADAFVPHFGKLFARA
ncbi:lipoyl(octanoyl) transferase LipB [Luteolibacter flavescens]|uniref:Octanoyltransferase n=1 Tax=Luteolibacter flavescens TaxID=1859460 RepID=A0ABT3FIH3_9BACT|nr:lipoyl(octanoyl) transferase LipB [Luteolibacter flavescens]MCW1883368.1 lipoyl(octanoyl) transferase LipB [Luteolibacter flavescens]